MLISSKELCGRLGISRAKFYSLRDTGQLGPELIRLGRSIRFRSDEVDGWISAGCPSRDAWLVELERAAGAK